MRESLKNKSAIVYVAVNSVNGKKYIGITCEKLSKRRTNHKHQAITAQYMSAFHRAIRKYGYDAFNWYTLSKWDNYKDAIEEEKRVISLFKPKYNITSGGEGSPGCKNNLGKKYPYKKRKESTGKNISEALKKSENLIRKKVICIETGKIFKSIADAGELMEINWYQISRICRGGHKTSLSKKDNKRYSFKFYQSEQV